jgi:hypothetical protein
MIIVTGDRLPSKALGKLRKVVAVYSQPAAESGVGGPDHAGYVDRITHQVLRSQDLESLITPTPVQNSDA